MNIPDFVLTEEQIMQMSDTEKVRLLPCENDTCFIIQQAIVVMEESNLISLWV